MSFRERYQQATNTENWGKWASEYWQIPALAAIFAFMLWTRIQKWQRFVIGDQVYFSGNDPWYHYRMVLYTVKNWPHVMPYDVWTGYPHGSYTGQFGTLFDQIVATVALIVGLGDPTTKQVGLALLFSVPIIGALTAVPVYVIGKRLAGYRTIGLLSALLLAVMPGTFFFRTSVGSADHHAAEAFLMFSSVAAILWSIDVAEREYPVWEIFIDKEWTPIISSTGPAAVAGFITALYLFTWPPAVLLIGMTGVFYTLYATARHLRIDTPEPVLLSGAVYYATTAVLVILGELMYRGTLYITEFRPTELAGLQITLPVMGAAWVLVMAYGTRRAEKYDPILYPVAVIVVGVVITIAMMALTPDLWRNIAGNIPRILTLGTTGAQQTIAEAQPMGLRNPLNTELQSQYGFAFYLAFFGMAAMAARSAKKLTGGRIFAMLVLVILSAAAITQQRFNYYLAPIVAVMVGYFIFEVFKVSGIIELRGAEELETYQALVLFMVLVLVFPTISIPGQVTVMESGQSVGIGAYQAWEEPMDWMEENTPETGLEYYGSYEFHRDQDFDYPESAYGVISWWDYGHWITYKAERIPIANPFQQNARVAAAWLLATGEWKAHAAIQGADTPPEDRQLMDNETPEEKVTIDYDLSGELTDGPVQNSNAYSVSVSRGNQGLEGLTLNKEWTGKGGVEHDDDDVKYAVVDWQMAYPESKFFAMTFFHDNVTAQEMTEPVYRPAENGFRRVIFLKKQRFYESMVTRLYYFHGSAVTPKPIVVCTDFGPGGLTVLPQNGNLTTKFNRMDQAKRYAEQNGCQVGGIGFYPQKKVDALNHWRLAKVSEASAIQSGQFMTVNRRKLQGTNLQPGDIVRHPAWVKIFEKVPGAEINGTGPANTTVRASVQLEIPTRQQSFTYYQYAQTGPNGSFTMTLPYSTTGETNVSVRAQGNYTFEAAGFQATVAVPEETVTSTNATPIPVTLKPRQAEQQGKENDK